MNKLISILSRKFNTNLNYFINGGFWLIVAQASTILFSMLVAVIMAKYVSVTDYGIYRYIIGLAALLSVFSLTGIGQTILQASSCGYKNFLQASTIITLKYSLGITITALTGAIYYYSVNNELLMYGCLLIAIFHPISQLYLNTLSHMYGILEFATGAKIQAIKSVFVSGTTIIILLFSQNLYLLLIVYFCSQAIASVAIYYFYKPEAGNPNSIPQKIWHKYISYAKNTSYRNILVGVASRLDSIVIFQHLGAKELALFSITTLMPDQIRSSLKNLQTLLIPKYTKYDSLHLLKKTIPKRSIQFFLVLLIITIIFIVIIPPIYKFLFPKYSEGAIYIQLLALSFPASISLIPLGALQAQHKEKALYIFHISTSFIQIATLLILVFNLGLIGAYVARILTQYSRTFIAYLLLYKSSA